MTETPLSETPIVVPRPPAPSEFCTRAELRMPGTSAPHGGDGAAHPGGIPASQPDSSADAAMEFAFRVLTGWHYVAELSVLGQPVCACGQPWDYCEYRLLARRCGLTLPDDVA
jgi:hypothetical protein